MAGGAIARLTAGLGSVKLRIIIIRDGFINC
jgi:hypothetical protein